MLLKSCTSNIQPKMTVQPIAITAIPAFLEKDWSAAMGVEGGCICGDRSKISNFSLPQNMWASRCPR